MSTSVVLSNFRYMLPDLNGVDTFPLLFEEGDFGSVLQLNEVHLVQGFEDEFEL